MDTIDDTADTLRRLDRIDRLARLMDTAIRVPGTRFRLGLDTIVGLVPGIGDTVALLPGLYILGTAWKMGVPAPVLGKMGMNVGIDWAIGSVPLLGDIFDAAFKANRRNAELLRTAMADKRPARDVTPPETTIRT